MGIFSRFAICSSLLGLLFGQQIGPVMASSLPAADRLASGASINSGPSLGVRWQPPGLERWQFGASVAAPFYFFQDFGTLRYGAWGMTQLLNQDGFFIAGIAGIYGDIYLPDTNRYSPLGLQLGAAFAYRLNAALTLRLNLVPGISLKLPPTGWVVFPPAGGAEIAWRWTANLETTLGYNGNGDIVGVNWIF